MHEYHHVEHRRITTMALPRYSVAKCAVDGNCWWIEGVGHFSGWTEEGVRRLAETMRLNDGRGQFPEPDQT